VNYLSITLSVGSILFYIANYFIDPLLPANSRVIIFVTIQKNVDIDRIIRYIYVSNAN